jgi:hypothetical protein
VARRAVSLRKCWWEVRRELADTPSTPPGEGRVSDLWGRRVADTRGMGRGTRDPVPFLWGTSGCDPVVGWVGTGCTW